MGAYVDSIKKQFKVTDEELADDVIDRSISGMDAAEQRQDIKIIAYRQQFEMRLSQLRTTQRQARRVSE